MKSTTSRERRKAAAAWALAVAGWAGVGLGTGLLGLGGGAAYAQSAVDWKTYQLRHGSAASLQPVLEQAIAGREAGAQVVANPQANQIHVRGTQELHNLAGQLVQTLDLPGQNPGRNAGPAPAAPAIEVRSYPSAPAQLAATAARLQAQFAAHPEVRIAADPRVGQILVAAPAEWQERVASQLAAAPAPSTRGQLEGHQVRLGPPQGAAEPEYPSARASAPLPAARAAVPAPRSTDRAPAAGFVPPSRPQAAPAAASAAPAVRPAAAPLGPRMAAAAGNASAPGPRGVLVSLEATPWNQVLAGLQGLWGNRLSSLPDPHPDLGMLRYDGPRGEVLEIQVNRRSHQFAIEGTPTLRAAAVRLVQMLDRGPPPAGQAMRVVGFQNARPAKIQKAVMAYQGDASDGEPAPKAAEAPKPLWRNDQSPLVKKIFRQVPGGPAPRDPNAPRNPDDPNDPENAPPPLEQPPVEQPPEDFRGGAFGQVQIEYVEGLDAFVIRGSEKDVAKITAIIDDLERLSRETEPEIEIYMLKNVASDALAQLALQLYDEILGSRLGRVSITPLGKPNAILLIGPAESVKLIKELLARLDQPVGPATQFEVFRLKHVAAATAQTTITNFYANRTGLGTRVQVSADFRTNSLLVQASPRDTAEISLLLKRIDSDENESVNELRLFPLQNAAADQLAAILTNSIAPPGGAATGAAGGQGAALNQPQIPGVGAAAALGGGGQAGASSAGPRSTTLRFMTIDQQGQQKLRSGILTDVRITADVRANALLVSAPPESMELIAALIRELDRIPTSESQIKVFTIVNGDAPSLSTMLGQLFGTGTQTGGGGGFGGLGGLGALGVQGNQLVTPTRFSVDQRTNSIIASGSADDLRIVEAILLRLDGSDVQDRKTEVFRLKNSPAADVSNAINQYLQNERAVQQNNPALLSAFEQIERQVVVVPEPVSNSLIVSATPRYFDEIQKIVEKLDARPPMVLIQVLIAEITLNNTDEFGIEMGLQDSVLFDRSVAAAGSLVPGYNFNNQPLGNTATPIVNPAYVGGQGLSNFALGRTNPTLGYGGLVLSASSENVSFLLRALKECRRLDVLSRPQVMTLDNQPAFIQVGQRVPRITGSTTNQTGQTNSTVLENVGLILGVTPRISPDNLVVMEVDAERSEVGPEAEGIPISISATGQVIRSPRINTTTAQTTVSALTGQTVVLGGLLTKNRQTTHRTVPVLDKIPVVRNLFRYDIETELRTELLIILTPNVVRTEEDSERLKRIEAARMSWCLADVQKMHGEAGLTPIPGENLTGEWADPGTTVVYGAPLPKGAQLLETPAGQRAEDVGPGLLMPAPDGSGPGLQPTPTPPAEVLPAVPGGAAPATPPAAAGTSRRNVKRN